MQAFEDARRAGQITEYEVYPRQSSDVDDYQVKAEDVPSPYSEDVRMLHNGELIAFWEEEKGIVWSKLPKLLAKTPQRVFGLTGNIPSAASNDDKTFEVFDSMENTAVDYYIDKIDDFSETTAYLQGVTCDGTYVYVSAAGAGYPGVLLKYTKAGNLDSSRVLSTVTDHVYHIGDLTVVGDYLYVADMINWEGAHADFEGKVVKFNKSDLTYAGEVHDVGDHLTESVKYWNGSWWMSFHCCSIIRQYNSSWAFVKEYDIDGHGATEESYDLGNGYQGLSVWEQNDNVYFGLTVHNSVAIAGNSRFYIFEYDEGEDSFTLIKYIEKNKGEFCHCQGWDVESGVDGSVSWFADRANAKIVKANVTTCFDGIPSWEDNWIQDTTQPGNAISQSDDYAFQGTYSAKEIYSTGVGGYYYPLGIINDDTKAVDFWVLFHDQATHDHRFFGTAGTDSSVDLDKSFYVNFEEDNDIDYYDGAYHPFFEGYGQDVWRRISIYDFDFINHQYNIAVDDVEVKANAGFHPDDENSANYLCVYHNGAGDIAYIDCIIVRKYASPEPLILKKAVLGKAAMIRALIASRIA